MKVHFKENDERISTKTIIIGILVLGILVASLIIYLINSSTSNIDEGAIQGEQIGESFEDDQSESVSIDIGKTVNEASNELNSINTNEAKENTTNTNTNKASSSSKKSTKSTNSTTKATTDQKENTVESTSKEIANEPESQEETKTEELKFSAPVKGEILREFASDSLVYSDTLEEWITHNGIDIKADKTSVVTAAAKGKVFAIKNDPRYGLTVIVNHDQGYQTIYSNLLTAEFVVEGEDIEAGQTIGTVR